MKNKKEEFEKKEKYHKARAKFYEKKIKEIKEDENRIGFKF